MKTQLSAREALERKIRRLRQEISKSPSFLTDLPETESDRALSAELTAALAQLREIPTAVSVGPFSGLTRAELAATGTCETDWF